MIENWVPSWQLEILSLAQEQKEKREITEREVNLKNNKYTRGKLKGATVSAKMRPEPDSYRFRGFLEMTPAVFVVCFEIMWAVKYFPSVNIQI